MLVGKVLKVGIKDLAFAQLFVNLITETKYQRLSGVREATV